MSESCVYFIRGANGLIKIGYSGNFLKRLQALGTSSPVPLEPLGLMEGGVELERELHDQFDHLRSYGEWFNGEKELYDYIERNTMDWRAFIYLHSIKVYVEALYKREQSGAPQEENLAEALRECAQDIEQLAGIVDGSLFNKAVTKLWARVQEERAGKTVSYTCEACGNSLIDDTGSWEKHTCHSDAVH